MSTVEQAYAGRLTVYTREMHLYPNTDTVDVGDTFEVFRGNGRREGQPMGTATVTELGEDGAPVLDIHLLGAHFKATEP